MLVYRILTGVDDAAFCHRLTEALHLGWSLYGSPSVTFDSSRQALICAQAITKEVAGRTYDPAMDLSVQ